MNYLLDGYNILFKQQDQSGTFEEQRLRLFEKLRFVEDELHLHCTLVLDAHHQIGELQRHHFHSLEIIYTDFAQTADDCIVDYIQSLPSNKRKQITVVTSDRTLMQKVRLERVEVLSVSAFFKVIEKRTRSRLLHKREKQRTQSIPTIERRPSFSALQKTEKNTVSKTSSKVETIILPPLGDNKAWIALFETLIHKKN